MRCLKPEECCHFDCQVCNDTEERWTNNHQSDTKKLTLEQEHNFFMQRVLSPLRRDDQRTVQVDTMVVVAMM
jgi:hypothetical protein